MINDLPFIKFVWGLKKPYLGIALIAIPLQFFLFKIEYPYPNFRGDSAAYIQAAFFNANATQWPVGYSKFLNFIHAISHLDTLLVSIQYALLELSALLFLFTLKYFLNPGKVFFNILFAFTIFNPIFLHLGNYIMSDAIFISLSLLWITQLFWIIYRPSLIQLFSQAILLFCLFTVRYNALFYPLVAALAFILSPLRWKLKMAGITLSLVLIVLFVAFTENAFYKLNGVRQFSPFGGWQLANNALYMYYNIRPDGSDKTPAKFSELDSITRKSFQLIEKEGLMYNHQQIRDFFIWDTVNSPLWQYKRYKYKNYTLQDNYFRWSSMGPIFSAYGNYLIQKHPIEYLKFFVLPNTANFFLPQIADLNYYNQGTDRIINVEALWFDYKYLKLTRTPKSYELNIISPYPFIIGFFNILFLLSITFYVFLKGYKFAERKLNNTIILISGFWLLNFCFSVSASTIEIRYQIFQLVLSYSMSVILMEWVLRIYSDTKLAFAD